MIDISKSGVNRVFVQIRSRGDALYNSNVVKMNHKVQKNFDPLQYILHWSKLLNIEIHGWLNTYLIWSAPYMPQDKSHLYYTHPEWFSSDYNGKSDIDIKINNIQSPNWEGLYLSPNHPSVNFYIEELVKEIIENYPELDGIHFDYIRFQDEYYGFNKVGINNFKMNYGFNPKDLYRGVYDEKFGWSKAEKDSIQNIWVDYNSMNITNLISSLRSYFFEYNLDVQLSAAVKSDVIESKYRWYQDWTKWIRDDLLDFVVVMNYTVNNNQFTDRMKNIKEYLYPSNLDDKIVMGISLFNQNDLSISDKILLSKLSGYDKICFFSYNSIKKESNILNSVRSSYNKKIDFLGE